MLNLKSILNLEHFEKAEESHSLCLSEIIYCETHAYVNVLSHVSVDPRTANMLKRLKHCCNLHGSSFITFVHHSGKTSFGKILC